MLSEKKKTTKETTAKNTTTKKTTVKKSATKKQPTKKATTIKTTVKETTTKKSPAKVAATKKSTAKETTVIEKPKNELPKMDINNINLLPLMIRTGISGFPLETTYFDTDMCKKGLTGYLLYRNFLFLCLSSICIIIVNDLTKNMYFTFILRIVY